VKVMSLVVKLGVLEWSVVVKVMSLGVELSRES